MQLRPQGQSQEKGSCPLSIIGVEERYVRPYKWNYRPR